MAFCLDIVQQCRSQPRNLYSHAPTMAKAQIATLLTTENAAIKLNFMDVQMQSGVNDCGLFSIAFATALVMGRQPGAFARIR